MGEPVAVSSGHHRHHHTGWPTERKRGWLLWYLHTETATSSLNEWLWQLTNEQLTQLIKSYRVTARCVTLQLCAGIPRFFCCSVDFLYFRHVAISQKLGGFARRVVFDHRTCWHVRLSHWLDMKKLFLKIGGHISAYWKTECSLVVQLFYKKLDTMYNWNSSIFYFFIFNI